MRIYVTEHQRGRYRKYTNTTRPSAMPTQRTQSDSWRASSASGSGVKPGVSLLTRSAPRGASATPPTAPSDPASAVGVGAITPSRMPQGSTRSRSSHGPQDAPWANYASTSSTSFYTPPPTVSSPDRSGTSPNSLGKAPARSAGLGSTFRARVAFGNTWIFSRWQPFRSR